MQRNNRKQKIDLIEELLNNPKDFSFIQALRILSKKLGDNYLDKIMIKPDLSLGFPTSDIIEINKIEDKFEIIVTFLGLYGASSPIPTFYTEELIDEKNNDRSIKRDFIDILNKRIYEFYFKLWLKTHPGVLLNEYKDEAVKKILFKIEYPLSVDKIKTLLKFYGFEVEIKEFVKSKSYISKNQTTKLTIQNSILSQNTHLGDKVSHTKKFKITIKKVDKDKFFVFMDKLKEINRLLFESLRESLEWEWEVEFKKAQKFKIGEMKVGINTVLGKTQKLIIKDKKW